MERKQMCSQNSASPSWLLQLGPCTTWYSLWIFGADQKLNLLQVQFLEEAGSAPSESYKELHEKQQKTLLCLQQIYLLD